MHREAPLVKAAVSRAQRHSTSPVSHDRLFDLELSRDHHQSSQDIAHSCDITRPASTLTVRAATAQSPADIGRRR